MKLLNILFFKRQLYLLFFLFLVPEYLFAESCPQDAISYWKLDDTSSSYEDYIGDHDGVCGTSCPAEQSDDGAVNSSQSFDGSSTGINIPAASDFDWAADGSFSIEMWVKRTSSTINNNGEVLIGRLDPESSLEWRVEIREEEGDHVAAFKLVNTAGDGGDESQVVVGSKPITPDKWHHIAVVRDAATNTNSLYMDGELEAYHAGLTYSAGFGSAEANMNIGWMDGSVDRTFHGLLDEIAVYRRVLTKNEIASHYYLSRSYCEGLDSPVRITPMGNSITKDRIEIPDSRPDSERGGYRVKLYEKLKAENKYLFDFVGSEGDQHDGLSDDFPIEFVDHTAWGGLTTGGLEDMLPDGVFPNPDGGIEDLNITGTYLENYETDVILLHIGTNDIGRGANFPYESIGNVANILHFIDDHDERITVVLALIISRPPDGNHAETKTYNDELAKLAENRINSGDKIIVVDMEDSSDPEFKFNYAIDSEAPYDSGDFIDDYHPNPTGYQKMADLWFNALQGFLPAFAPPVLDVSSVPNAGQGQLYNYTIPTQGSGPFIYTLVKHPEGMTIDDNGQMAWTPTSMGTHDVVVRVSNQMAFGESGVDEQPFKIEVVEPTLGVPDEYPLNEGTTLDVSADKGVLANDAVNGSGGTLTAEITKTTQYGELTLNSDGSFTYVHDGSEVPNDVFTYRVNSDNGEMGMVEVTLVVTGVNDAPVITGQVELKATAGKPLKIQLSHLVVEDPDNDYPSGFTLTIDETADYTIDNYSITPNSSFVGAMKVPVTVSDGTNDSNTYQLSLNVSSNNGNSGSSGSSGSSSGCFIDSSNASQAHVSGKVVVVFGILAVLGIISVCLPSDHQLRGILSGN